MLANKDPQEVFNIWTSMQVSWYKLKPTQCTFIVLEKWQLIANADKKFKLHNEAAPTRNYLTTDVYKS